MSPTPRTAMHARTDDTQPANERAMLAYGVSHDGHRFLYNGYRYDRWEDAVDQAELMLSRPLERWLKQGGGPAPDAASAW